MSKKQFRFVEVRWHDTMSISTWVSRKNLLTEAKTPEFISRGWLMIDNKRQVTLAATISDQNDDDIGDVVSIPRGAILGKIRTLKNGLS